MPWTLSTYISRHFFLGIMLALFGLLSITMLIDVLELVRRASGREAATLGVVLEMALLKIPFMMIKVVPYGVLIGSMLALIRLTRTHELVVARAAGISVWQFLKPALLVVFLMGSFMVGAFNPISAVLLLRYEQIEAKYFTGQENLLSISPSGLWLRQMDPEGGGEHVIYAQRISQADMSFSSVMLLRFDGKKHFMERLDAQKAVLEDGFLVLSDVVRSKQGAPPQFLPRYALPTTLTLGHIQDSFASPETMSFWHLPGFISMLEEAGFSGLKHRLYYFSLIASPFLLMGMVFVAAVFSLRLPRQGKIGLMMTVGIVTGFILYFFTDLVYALGTAGTLPVWLAAAAPTLVVSMVGGALLLHLEDG